MSVNGLNNLKLNYIRVVRHFGLQDVKISLMIKTDLSLTGQYTLQGSAIGFLPVTGDGNFKITVKNAEFLAITYAVAKSANTDSEIPTMILKELDIQMTYDSVDFKFENLMGGGIVGSTANLVINAMGEAIIEAQKNEMIEFLRKKWHNVIQSHL